MSKFILVFPQWQGSTDIGTYEGAKELKALYLQNAEYTEVPVMTEPDTLEKKNNIVGYEAVQEQMGKAAKILQEHAPKEIFTVGGGCDADIPPIAYLNEKLQGDLTIVWLDAHGDLNSPAESKSGRFYGMPARVLSGVSPLFTELVPLPIKPEQLINVGGRAFDKAESRYMEEVGTVRISVADFVESPQSLIDAIKEKGSSNVYVHLDLDVLDPKEFTHMGLHVPGGLPTEKTTELIRLLKENFHLVGLGLYEYLPAGDRNEFIQSVVELSL